MKKATARKETARERKERLRGKWSDRLWTFCMSSSHVVCAASADTYIVTQDLSSIHLPTPPKTARLALHAYLEWTLLDAAAAFFEKNPKAKYLVVAVIANGTGKKSPKRAVITGWLE